ncbi:glycosyltransferase family 9 protein [Phaeospirillum tilakii]|uniref:Glycosyltransferase family 9 protein n=1 Tax=Phaeospirillum tilakii TaxID=741673 RepID=A0ABW5CDU6_9PROT
MPELKRILILRYGGVGDHIIFSDALRQIRRLEPDAHITMLAPRHVEDLYAHNPYINAWVAAPELAGAFQDWGFDFGVIDDALGELRETVFDYLYDPDPHQLSLSGLVVSRLTALRKIGFRQQHWILPFYQSNRYFTDLLDRPVLPHIAQYQSIFFRAVYGVDYRTEDYAVFFTPFARQRFRAIFPDPLPGRGLVALHCAGTDPSRRLSLAQVEGLIAGLVARGYIPLLIGQQPYEIGRGGAVDLTRLLTISEQACLLGRCAALIGVDSGGKHLAAAMRLPICEIGHIPAPLLADNGALIPESAFCALSVFAPVNGCRHELVLPTAPGLDRAAVESGAAIQSVAVEAMLAGFDRLRAAP